MGTKTKLVVAVVIAVAGILTATTGYTTGETKEGASLVLRNLVAKDGKVTGEMSLTKAPSGKIDVKARQSVTGESLGVAAHSMPVNLWILVDASQLCQVNKIDQYLGAQLTELKRTLHPKSTLSVASFTNTSLEVPHTHQLIGDVEDIGLRCDPKLLSTSYEKALSRLMETATSDQTTTMVWIYTSGNVSLSDKMIASLQSKKINLHLILYNAILENDIRPLIVQANLKLGNDRVQLSVLNPQNGFVPERLLGISIDAPNFFNGGNLPLAVTASVDGKEVAVDQATVAMPVSGDFWPRNRIWILSVLALLVVAYLAYRVIRFYKAKFCKACGHRMRHTDEMCLFCQKSGQAFLVGRFNIADRKKFNRVDVLPLVAPVVELGSHRRSKVKWLKVPGKRRSVYLTIERDVVSGKNAYRAKGNVLGNVQVNGVPLAEPRYLAPGDEIQIDGVSMTFVCRRSNEAANR